MVYKAIGLMSGSSLDGLDIVYTFLEENRGQWKFDIQQVACVPYDEYWLKALKTAAQLQVPDFLRLNTEYGRYIGERVNEFIREHGIEHQVHLIASHGHTVFHEPAKNTTGQIGDGATIAAVTGLPVISDLRALDVGLGGQGAPIVPIGDRLLFGNFDYWLNIGGIVNITVKQNESMLAFDVCTGNQILNKLAEEKGLKMDEEGVLAQQGKVLEDVLKSMNAQEYFQSAPPKSLSNEKAMELVAPLLQGPISTEDRLRTAVKHIVDQIAAVVKKFPPGNPESKMLMTGGGALNNFLAEEIKEALQALNVSAIIPYEEVVQYKEALVMALIGVLRWREETNVLSSVTGAKRDSISGALWMGHEYSQDKN